MVFILIAFNCTGSIVWINFSSILIVDNFNLKLMVSIFWEWKLFLILSKHSAGRTKDDWLSTVFWLGHSIFLICGQAGIIILKMSFN